MIAVSSDGTAEEIGHRFVGAEAVANEVVRRLSPNELSSNVGDYIREIAKFGTYYWHTMLFGGSLAIALDATARPDGSLHLELQDWHGSRIWQIDLRPVE